MQIRPTGFMGIFFRMNAIFLIVSRSFVVQSGYIDSISTAASYRMSLTIRV